jgi:hypothetical protein
MIERTSSVNKEIILDLEYAEILKHYKTDTKLCSLLLKDDGCLLYHEHDFVSIRITTDDSKTHFPNVLLVKFVFVSCVEASCQILH